MATIEKCSVCGANAAVRWKPGTGRARFLVWVECTRSAGHTHGNTWTADNLQRTAPAESGLYWHGTAENRTNQKEGEILWLK